MPGDNRSRAPGYAPGVLIGTIRRYECRNDDLQLIFRVFPIFGPESTAAARGAPASRVQVLYEPFRGALLGADGPFDLDHILAITRSVGLDVERLARDREDPYLDAPIELATASGPAYRP